MLARFKSCGFALPLSRPFGLLTRAVRAVVAEAVGTGNVFNGSSCRRQVRTGNGVWVCGEVSLARHFGFIGHVGAFWLPKPLLVRCWNLFLTRTT